MLSTLSVPAIEARHEVSGVTLHVVEAGPADAPLVVLLHGFPDFWWSWRRQIESLARAGLRVVAPDQRGYNLSDKPEPVRAYDLDTLAADVIALADRYGRNRVRLVGHDWGGLVAWWAATRYPHHVERLVAINAPHPSVVGRYMLGHPAQVLRSSYMAFFQLPVLPERMLARDDFALMKRGLRGSSRPGTFSDSDLAAYETAWRQPGALTSMLNWYRALRHRPTIAKPRVSAPTLLIWGVRDAALERGLAEASLKLCDAARPVWFERATHWVHLEESDEVNEALVTFLSG